MEIASSLAKLEWKSQQKRKKKSQNSHMPYRYYTYIYILWGCTDRVTSPCVQFYSKLCRIKSVVNFDAELDMECGMAVVWAEKNGICLYMLIHSTVSHHICMHLMNIYVYTTRIWWYDIYIHIFTHLHMFVREIECRMAISWSNMVWISVRLGKGKKYAVCACACCVCCLIFFFFEKMSKYGLFVVVELGL